RVAAGLAVGLLEREQRAVDDGLRPGELGTLLRHVDADVVGPAAARTGIAADCADGKNRDASNACEPGEFHPVSSSNTPGRRVLSRSTLGRRPPPPRPEGGLAPSGAL